MVHGVQHVSHDTGADAGWWFGTFFIFPYIGNNHHKLINSYFSEGLKPPASRPSLAIPSGNLT